MSTATSSFAIEKDSEPIPGYRLEKRIGVGGYGEVWKATAPGGLAKALKIIHGQIDGTRATRELRSLDHAKTLSHPFLLSLERIEIVDGHVIIVSELADGTLKDRYEQCRAAGMPGIPREELIEYCREAADALDYLFDSHALQHLDIKPENLLILGKHIKVADFGLLRDLQVTRDSLVNGMTPRYSSPEMFDGKPGRYSDQYSLAIVYQEMACGKLPFSGTSIAALASHHLNSTPDLSDLAPLERFAVGKALSKDPRHRFPTCRAFVERLMQRSSAAILVDSRTGKGLNGSVGGVASDCGSRVGNVAANVHDGQTIEVASPEITSLPRLPMAGALAYRPTIFIGIGGTGGRVLCKLRQLLSDRIGEAKELPALQFLHVDTDTDAIQSIAAGPWNEGLREHEIVITPLRQTQDYRSSSVSRLDSISRRWIYNVPRSLRTQGLRALGRISFLDHADRLLDRIREAVIRCTTPQSITTTAEETGLPFLESDPRVFVVASLSGGAGSGMVIDAGYAIRQVLAECGFTDDDVCGVLTYGVSRGSQRCSIAAANTYACLEELRYFAQPGCDYPGEPTCGLAAFQNGGPTFRHTYLFDVGDDASKGDFTAAIGLLSEYLFQSSVSTTHVALDQCRRLEREHPSEEPLRIRTARACPFAIATHEDPAPLAESLCRFLVRKWKVGLHSATNDDRVKLSELDRLYEVCDPKVRTDNRVGDLAQAEMERLGITLKSLTDTVVRIASEKLHSEPCAYLRNVISDSLGTTGAASQDEPGSALNVALRRIQTIIGLDEGQAEKREHEVETLSDLLLPEVLLVGTRLGESLAAWILSLVDMESTRVDGARQAASRISDLLSSLQRTALDQLAMAQAELEASCQAITALQSKTKQHRGEVSVAATTSLQHLSQRLLDVLFRDAVCKAVRKIDPSVTIASDQIRELWKNLTQLADEFRVTTPDAASAKSDEASVAAGPGPALMSTLFAAHQAELIEELDREMTAHLLHANHGLCQVLTQGGSSRNNLTIQMRTSARKLILRACDDASHAYVQQALSQGGNEQFSNLLRKCLQQALPDLLTQGGAKRLLLVVPSKLDVLCLAREVEQLANDRVSVILEQGGDVMLCYEVENLRYHGIQSKLLRQSHDCRELAARLHTRINIDWTVG